MICLVNTAIIKNLIILPYNEVNYIKTKVINIQNSSFSDMFVICLQGEETWEQLTILNSECGRVICKVVLAQRKKKAQALGGWGKGVNFSFPHVFLCVLLLLLCTRHWAKWVSYIISHVLWPPYGKKNIFLALFFRWGNRDSEKLSNLPKVTQLMNGRARNQIQLCLFMTAHYYFSNKLCLRYRALKVENVFHVSALKNCLIIFMMIYFLCL